jgi:hypothetical protein
MSKYNLKMLKQQQYFKGGKFEIIEEEDMGNNYTWENVQLATSHETLKFFRKSFHSKQRVTTEIKNGLTVVKIYSYEPYSNTKRSLHVYTEIKEG